MKINLSNYNIKDFFIRNFQIILIVILVFFLLKSCDVGLELKNKNAKLETRKDSLQNLSKRQLDQVSDLEMVVQAINDTVKFLKKESKVSENRLYALQKKISFRPKYIYEIQNCNDTIQSIYNLSVTKDSLCNNVISDKNKIIVKQDKVIIADSLQKTLLRSVVEKKDLAITVQDEIISNNKKQIRKEKTKKTFWQIVTGVLIVLGVLK